MKRNDLAHLSFEFFPPKTPRESQNLIRTAQRLAIFEPDFCSVTHGAGGSAREGTLETVQMLREHGFKAIPHLTWGDDSREDMLALLETYANLGVRDLVALRGDVSNDATGERRFRYAQELVTLIREEMGDQFRIHVGCYPEMHPEATSISGDICRLKEKVDAGVDQCITQYFYNGDAYQAFVDSCVDAGISQPILPGIMPISNFEKLVQFSEKCGAEIPRWLLVQLRSRVFDVNQLRTYGADVVANLCKRLIADGAPGLHVYTLNLARPTQLFLWKLFSP